MSLKAKILTSLKTKYKNLGLSEKVLDGMADMLALTTTEEENIETAVAGVENLLKGIQSDSDARVTEAIKKNKPEQAKLEPAKPDPAKTEENQATAEIAKIINAAISPLIEKVAALEAGNVSKSRKQILEEKLKDVNPTIKAKILKDFGRMTIEKDEDFNAYVEETIADVGELSKVVTTETLGTGGRPIVGNQPVKGKEASKEELDAVMDKIPIV